MPYDPEFDRYARDREKRERYRAAYNSGYRKAPPGGADFAIGILVVASLYGSHRLGGSPGVVIALLVGFGVIELIELRALVLTSLFAAAYAAYLLGFGIVGVVL